jgi:hypothetical protein
VTKPELKLDWCSHEAAKYAVEKWHYSQRMPVGKSAKVGVWENGSFIGVILFAMGANKDMAAKHCEPREAAELVRVALTKHQTQVSRIVAIAVRMLHKQSEGLRLLVSYADTTQGHHGGIYQAGGWVYCGQSQASVEWFHEGRWKHNREMTGGPFGQKRRLATSDLPSRKQPGKHKYLMPLDAAMRAQIEPLHKPYPKRV